MKTSAVTTELITILSRLSAHGRPVRHTKLGFELDRGVLLCRMDDMRSLANAGLVERTGDGLYQVSPAGIDLLHETDPDAHYADFVPDLLPPWAIGRTNDPTHLGAQLRTRDGRRLGNAVTVAVPRDAHGLTVSEVLTDAGTTVLMTRTELESAFYPPEWFMDIARAPGMVHRKARASDSQTA